MTIHGLSELQGQLQVLGAELGQKILVSAARKAFLPVLEDAKRLVPVDTGLTRDSIKIGVVKVAGVLGVAVGLKIVAGRGGSRKVIRNLAKDAQVGKSLAGAAKRNSAHWRWHFTELGTSKTAAKPFLRPALVANSSLVLDSLREELTKKIAAALRKQKKGKKR